MTLRKTVRILSWFILSVVLLCCYGNVNAEQPAFGASFIKDELNQFTGLKITVESQTANITGFQFDIVVSEGITVTGRRLTMAGWSISGTTTITLAGPAARIVTVYVNFNVDPGLTDNPTISISNILVRTTGGDESLSNQTLTVMLHEEPHIHTYSIFQVIEPTVCGQHGRIVYMCECGETYEEETAELEHQPTGVFITLIEATCTQEGIKAQYCELCIAELFSEVIPPSGHQPAEAYTVVLEPTCTGEGEQAQLCQVCGAELNNEPIPTIAHPMGEWIPDDLWCTQERTETRFCQQCKTYTEYQQIPANISHDIIKTSLKEPTCVESGLIRISCSRCAWSETEETPASGHYLTSQIIYAATCQTSGMLETYCVNEGCGHSSMISIEKLDHNYDMPILFPGKDCETIGMEKTTCRDCGHELIREFPASGHDFTDWSPVSCEEGGVSHRICSRCSAEQDMIIPPGNHIWGDEIVGTVPTCMSPGKAVKECIVCGEKKEREIEKLEHVYDIPVLLISPLCETNGLAGETCGLCGYTRTSTIISSGHRWNDWIIDALTSCLIDGNRSRTCADCGATQSEPLASHNFPDWSVLLPASCTQEGKLLRTCSVCKIEQTQTISMLPHSYGLEELVKPSSCSATGEAVSQCLFCPAQHVRILDQLPHQFSEWVITRPAGCIEEGIRCRECKACRKAEEQSIAAIGHHYVGNILYMGCGQAIVLQNTCNHCGDIQLSELEIQEHRFFDWKTEQKPECEKDGMETRFCSLCNLVEMRTLPELYHLYESWEIVSQTSCSVPGIRTASCLLCGRKTDEQIPVSDHIFTPWHQAVTGDCSSESRMERQCVVCGAREDQSLPPREHVFEAWQISRAASCRESGLRTRGCRYCSYSEDEELDTLSHQYGSWVNGPMRTCETEGVRKRVCKVCRIEQAEVLPAGTHRFHAWEIRLEPTCTDTGERARRCKYCAFEEVQELETISHLFAPWTEAARENCELQGMRFRDCTHCGFHEEGPLKPGRHVFHKWEIVNESTCDQTGLRARKCKRCIYIETQELPLRKHIAGGWTVSRKAALFHPGEQVRQCKNCGQTLLSRPYYPGDKSFTVSICVYGPQFKVIWPDLTDEWYRFARIDLTREGQTIFQLIGNNTHQVGEVTATVSNGMVKIEYSLFGKRTKVFKERIQLLIPGMPVTAENLSSNLQGRKVSRNISISRSLKGAASALLFLRFDGIFDIDDPDLIPLSALEDTTNRSTGNLPDIRQMSQLVMEEFNFGIDID